MRVHLSVFQSCAAFATVGATAGWLSYNLLSNPAVHVIQPGHPLLAAACTALWGAAAGLLLAPRPARAEWLPPRPTPARIAVVIFAAGALAGALVTWAVLPHASPGLVATGLANGLLCAVPFILFGLAMVSAMRRASRARPGSIVARADRRTIACVLAVALGCTTVLALPDWPAAAQGLRPEPAGAMALIAASGLFVACLVLIEMLTEARLHRLHTSSFEMECRPPEDAELPVARIDFGVGEQVMARVAPGPTYRVADRPLSLLVGDAGQALAAVRRSLRWSVMGLALLEAVAIGHGLARGVDADASYSAWLCEDLGRLRACRQAALLAEGAGRPDTQAIRLHQRACAHGDARSCLAIELLYRRNLP